MRALVELGSVVNNTSSRNGDQPDVATQHAETLVGFLGGARAPNMSSRQVGTPRPTPESVTGMVATSLRQGVSGKPSKWRVNWMATSGCRAYTMGKQSAQLARKQRSLCALHCEARDLPGPEAEQLCDGPLRRTDRPGAAKLSTNTPTCLRLLQMCLDEGGVSQRRAQHHNSLLGRRQIGLTRPTPNTGSRVRCLCNPLQRIATGWLFSAPVPDLRLAPVDANSSVGEQVPLQRTIHVTHPIWDWRHDPNVVKVRDEFFLPSASSS